MKVELNLKYSNTHAPTLNLMVFDITTRAQLMQLMALMRHAVAMMEIASPEKPDA